MVVLAGADESDKPRFGAVPSCDQRVFSPGRSEREGASTYEPRADDAGIGRWGLAKEARVLAVEVRRASVTDVKRD